MLFGVAWKRANRFGSDQPPAPAGRVFAIIFLLSLVMSVNLAFGTAAGFAAGLGWVAMGIGIVALFENRPWSYVFVNGGYLTVALTLMGAILGGWC